MNSAARMLEQTLYLEGRMGSLLLTTRMVSVLALLLIVLASAFAVVYEREVFRFYTSQLQNLQKSHIELRVESKQLLLEQTTWATQSRIQEIAENQLRMSAAIPAKIIMVRS